MLLRSACLAVVALVVASSPAAKKGTFPALDKKNPVCTFAVDKIRIKGDPEQGAAKFYKKTKACKGPQGYAIQECQLKQCQCRKFHTHVDATTHVVTTWAECLPKKKDSTMCVGADQRYCENLLRGKDPLSKSAAGAYKNGRNTTTDDESSSKSSSKSSSSSRESKSLSGGTGSATQLSTAQTDKAKDAGSFPVVAVVLASVGVILAILGGTWLVVSKKKKPKASASTGGTGGGHGGAAKDPQGLEFDDFDDDDHNHKDLYTDAKSTSAAVHTVAVPPARRHSSGSISSVSSSDSDEEDDDDKHDADHDDSWTAYSKK